MGDNSFFNKIKIALGLNTSEKKAVQLEKSLQNPIISPRPDKPWESWQTFNPAAVYLEGRVHFLYRAIGEGGLSVLGYAASENGIDITERSDKAAYVFKQGQIEDSKKDISPLPLNYCSGGSFAGCEDPRMTAVGDKIYMIHTTFNGWSLLRMTLTSIKKHDFLNKRWEKWRKPVFISPPRQINKNWVIFPEKINGKFAILHSISPDILIDYFDSLDFDGKTFIKSQYFPSPVKDGWEGSIKGIGPPPIKTDKGWLVLYHALAKNDSGKYKIGAMILDYSNPTKVLYRAKEPILEPDYYYENNGHKPGIVYSCGAVVIEDTLFVYYGGADSVACVATTPLKEFVNSLSKEQKPKFGLFSFLKPK